MNKQSLLTILILGLTFIYQGQSVAVKQAANFVPSSDPIDAMAMGKIQETLDQYNEKLFFSKVTQCFKQTVAGKVYDMTVELFNANNTPVFYNIVIYVKPWENFTEVQRFQKIEKSQTNDDEIQEISEQKQEQVLPSPVKQISQPKQFEDIMNSGAAKFLGKKVVETNKPEEVDFSSETELIKIMIEKQIQSLLNSTTSIKITKAVKQVVSGLKYYLEFTDGAQTYSADFIVQLWNNSIKAFNFKQTSEQVQEKYEEQYDYIQEFQTLSAEQIDGGKVDFSFQNEDATVKAMIAKALEQKLNVTGLLFEDLEITSATKQIVAGEIFSLYFTFQGRDYYTKLYLVPWEKKAQIQKFTAFNNRGDYQNNHMPGGYRGDLQFFRFEEEPLITQDLIKKTILSVTENDVVENIQFYKTKKSADGKKYKLTFGDGKLFYKVIMMVNSEEETAEVSKIFKFTPEQWEQFAQWRQQQWGQGNNQWQGHHQQQWNQNGDNQNQQQLQQGNLKGGKKFNKGQGLQKGQEVPSSDFGMVGGFQDVDFSVVDPEIKKMILKAIADKLNVNESDIEVVKAQYQVVNGLNYKLTFQSGESLNYVEAFILPQKFIVQLNNLKQNI